jgi:UDP-N-acetylglucosamine--N-acetylmuramyl-(pentapeptide) pyrophosphoryl-undecaprenol N-acetylglucosamine transferase
VIVVFAGGGTGGHVYPAVAIADALRDRAHIAFIGTADRLEARLVPRAGYRLYTIASRPLARSLSLDLVKTIGANAYGVQQAVRLLRKLKPDLVVATGGYVCLPVVLAARVRGIPVALLEPNARPGLTNRLLAPLVAEVWGAFPQADSRFAGKYHHTGVPVRAALRALPSRERAAETLGLSPGRRTLLAMGGSQGARSINDALVSLVRQSGLPKGWQLLHLTGEGDYERVRAALHGVGGGGETPVVRPYLDDLSSAYAASDLVLSRAGASTLGELVAVRRPAILVPYPYAAGDHQRANAQRMAQSGAAMVLEDHDLDAETLRAALLTCTLPERFAEMTKAAAGAGSNDPVATIVGRVEHLVSSKSGV